MQPTGKRLAAVLAMLLATACSQEPSRTPKTPAPPVVAPTTAMEPVKQEARKVETKVEATATEVKKEAEQDASSVAEEAKTAVTETVDAAKQDALDALTPASLQPAAKAPTLVRYAAAPGTVTFNHANHADRLDCGNCHTNDPPRKIAIDKEVAHALCRGCHQQSGGKAPLACNGCHKK